MTGGLGAAGDVETVEGVLKSSVGGMVIDVYRELGKVYASVTDGYGTFTAELPVTAEQYSGTEWMLVKVSRDSTSAQKKLYFTLGDNEPVAVNISNSPTYSGDFTFMSARQGSIFDARVLNSRISDNAFKYYVADVLENAGKSLLPNR